MPRKPGQFIPPPGRGVKRGKPLPFAEWLQLCTPGKWSIRCWSRARTADGEVLRRHIDVPADRNLTAAMARDGFPPGVYKVRAIFRGARGGSYDLERGTIGMRPRQSVETGEVTLSLSMVEAPPEPPSTGAGGVQAAREAKQRAQLEAEAEEHRATLAEQRARRIKAERAAELDTAAAAPPAPPATDVAGIVQLLIQQQQQQQQLLLQMLQQTRDEAARREERILELVAEQQQTAAPAAPAAPATLESILAQLKLLREVKAAFTDDDDEPREPEPDSFLGLVRELRHLLPNGLAGGQAQLPAPPQNRVHPHSNGAAAAAAVSQSAAPAAAADPARSPAPVGQQRVQQFVQLLLQEFQNGSDPDTVAEQLDSAIGLLPLQVRAALERGDWSAAWAACKPHLPAEAFAALDAILSESVDAQGWCVRLAEACELEPEGEA